MVVALLVLVLLVLLLGVATEDSGVIAIEEAARFRIVDGVADYLKSIEDTFREFIFV